MTVMIRRVAESQAEFDGRSLIHMPRFERERYMARARAAIMAMREPTVLMRAAAYPRITGDKAGLARDTFTAMIDAALQEQN